MLTVKSIVSNPNYLRFLGTVILYQDDRPKAGVHYDYTGLLANIPPCSFDGQQRMSTVALICWMLHNDLSAPDSQTLGDAVCPTSTEFKKVLSCIKNAQFSLSSAALQLSKSKMLKWILTRKPINLIRALNE